MFRHEAIRKEEFEFCPFCKSKNLGLSNKTTTQRYKRKRHLAVYCKDCNCYGPRVVGEEIRYNDATDEAKLQAVKEWNRRAEVAK